MMIVNAGRLVVHNYGVPSLLSRLLGRLRALRHGPDRFPCNTCRSLIPGGVGKAFAILSTPFKYSPDCHAVERFSQNKTMQILTTKSAWLTSFLPFIGKHIFKIKDQKRPVVITRLFATGFRFIVHSQSFHAVQISEEGTQNHGNLTQGYGAENV